MTDRERVIKGLESQLDDLSKYADADEVFTLTQGQVKDILALLKEQEAIPVEQREIAHMLFWCCGSCGVAITEGDKFCRNCGKKMKWNERDHHRST